MLAKRSPGHLLLAIALLFGAAESASAERLDQSTTDIRTVLHFNANKDAVQKLLPAGWVSTPGTGALKDANISIVFIESVAVENAEGKPVPSQNKFAVIVVPAKNEQAGVTAPIVVGGFASPSQNAPGAYGVYVPARITMAKSSRSSGPEATAVEEAWDVSNDAGDQLRFSVSYERRVGTRAHIEPRVYSAAKPEFYRIYKVDQVSEVVHTVVDDVKRTGKVEFSGSGPHLSKVFDGTEQVVAVTSIPSYSRRIFLPD